VGDTVAVFYKEEMTTDVLRHVVIIVKRVAWPLCSHLGVLSRNQSFYTQQIFFKHAVIIKFVAVQYTVF
jgi:hypothetical protein